MSFYSETEINAGMSAKTGRLITKALPKDSNRVFSIETEPAIEPVTVIELKTFARIDYSDEDSLLEGFITAVRMAAEEYTGRSFIERTIVMLMDWWPGTVVELPRPPLISITKVATLDEDDTETEYASTNYYVVTAAVPGKLVLKQSVQEPTNTDRDYSGFLIRYKAGYGDEASDVPGPIKEGIKTWASIAQATRVIDPKNPPPEACTFLDLYRTAEVMIR
ncbi:MAG: phage head-tail connector protein [Gammaproteobacteria bacterium]|nr:phage head-tail connector protein [Gammaproteobacteria bacterium]